MPSAKVRKPGLLAREAAGCQPRRNLTVRGARWSGRGPSPLDRGTTSPRMRFRGWWIPANGARRITAMAATSGRRVDATRRRAGCPNVTEAAKKSYFNRARKSRKEHITTCRCVALRFDNRKGEGLSLAALADRWSTRRKTPSPKIATNQSNSRGGDRTRTGIYSPQDFKSCASANFATRPTSAW